MSSPAQVLANRQNAARSTGPKSPEGKAASSRNATRHGLTAVFHVLPHEDPAEFEQLAAAVRHEFRPRTDSENFLVDLMIQARCKLVRFDRLQGLAFEQVLTEPGSSSDPDARILAALGASGNMVDKLERYAASARRAYYQARRELESSRVRIQRMETKALNNYMKAYIFAPTPIDIKRMKQNEANSRETNPALRL
jgi:hypothetical protein